MNSFNQRLNTAISRRKSLLCVGLDPDPEKMPPEIAGRSDNLEYFCKRIIDATHEFAVAYKPNLAFFEAHGPRGWQALEAIAAHVPDDVLLVLDGKRGDIGNTGRQYARYYFENLDADAVTLQPYMGGDSLLPFLGFEGKGAFILALTSNPGAADLQHETVNGKKLYHFVADKVQQWNSNDNCGLVVGATDVENMKQLRAYSDLPFLVPGIGAQGGDLAAVIENGADRNGHGLLINVGRDILYRSAGDDFDRLAGERAAWYTELMRDKGRL
jgi:orotidine-5'-phosphate decarboxylase